MSMKYTIKSALQRGLGYRRFLRLFALFKVWTLRLDSREKDFFLFLSMLPEEGTVLDIGANLGFLTYYLAKRVRRGRVIAFEPMPDNLQALRFTISHFRLQNVAVEPCALGDRNGDANMVLPMFGASMEQGLVHVVHELLTDNNDGIRFTVELRRLDDVASVSRPGTVITGIKMDVENFEQFVLRGARQLIERHQPLIYIELMNNDNRRRCFELAAELGYTVKVHVDGRLVEYDESRHADRINMFMVHAVEAGASARSDREWSSTSR